MQNSPSEDKSIALKQQATIVRHKKETRANELRDWSKRYESLAKDVEDRDALNSKRLMDGEEFKKFVAELRTKSGEYKTKKNELSVLTAEVSIMQRTEEVRKGCVLSSAELA